MPYNSPLVAIHGDIIFGKNGTDYRYQVTSITVLICFFFFNVIPSLIKYKFPFTCNHVSPTFGVLHMLDKQETKSLYCLGVLGRRTNPFMVGDGTH